jgi:hypothetical protein
MPGYDEKSAIEDIELIGSDDQSPCFVMRFRAGYYGRWK